MEVTAKVAVLILLVFTFLFYNLDLNLVSTTKYDNQEALERAAKTAISQSIEKGTLRVMEEIHIDEAVAEEVFLRAYAQNVNMNDPEARRYLFIKEITANPPLIAVQSITENPSLFEAFLDGNEEVPRIETGFADIEIEAINNSLYTTSKAVVIYEAKCLEKPKGGICDDEE